MKNLILTLFIISGTLIAQKIKENPLNAFTLEKKEIVTNQKVYGNGFLYQCRYKRKPRSMRIVKINKESEIVASLNVSQYASVIFREDKIIIFNSKDVDGGFDYYSGLVDLNTLKFKTNLKKIAKVNIGESYKWTVVENSENIAVVVRTNYSDKVNEQLILLDSNGDLIKEENYTYNVNNFTRNESWRLNGDDYLLTENGVFELITKHNGKRKPRNYFIRKIGTDGVFKLNTPDGAYKLKWQKNETGENAIIVGVNAFPTNWPVFDYEAENELKAKGILLSKFNSNDYKSTKLITKDIPQFRSSNVMDIRNIMFLKTGEIVIVFHGGGNEEYQRGPVTAICLDQKLKTKWISNGPMYVNTMSDFPPYLGIIGCLSFEKEGYIHFLYNRMITVEAMGAQHSNKIYPPKNNMELVAGKMSLNNGKYTEKAIWKYKKWKSFIKPNEGTELMKGVYRFDTFKKKKFGFLTITF